MPLVRPAISLCGSGYYLSLAGFGREMTRTFFVALHICNLRSMNRLTAILCNAHTKSQHFIIALFTVRGRRWSARLAEVAEQQGLGQDVALDLRRIHALVGCVYPGQFEVFRPPHH